MVVRLGVWVGRLFHLALNFHSVTTRGGCEAGSDILVLSRSARSVISLYGNFQLIFLIVGTICIRHESFVEAQLEGVLGETPQSAEADVELV